MGFVSGQLDFYILSGAYSRVPRWFVDGVSRVGGKGLRQLLAPSCRTRISQIQRYRWTDHELQQPATAGLGAAIYRIAVVLTEQAIKSFFPIQQLVNQDQALNRGTAMLRRTFPLALQ
jgi:hypothetical protein